MTRIWQVTFQFSGDSSVWTRQNVEANNIGEAIRKARAQRKGEYCNRIQDISAVELLAET